MSRHTNGIYDLIRRNEVRPLRALTQESIPEVATIDFVEKSALLMTLT